MSLRSFSTLGSLFNKLKVAVLLRSNLIILLICLITVLLIPLKIVSLGYQAPDDALRHAAKVVSGKEWGEVLVLKSGVTIDQHHGWHVFLGFFHEQFGFGTTELMVFSVVFLMVLFMCAGLPWTKYPEIWILVLLVISLAMNIAFRWALGRPFILSMSFTVFLMFYWRGWGEKLLRPFKLIVLVLLYALVTHIHGSWYLFALPSLAFLLSGKIRLGLVFTVSWLLGTILGSMMGGDPWAYLIEPIEHLFSAVGDEVFQKQLVKEFQPSDGSFNVLIAFICILYSCIQTKSFKKEQLREPSFILFALGWLLGLWNIRFWADWGIPSLMVCLCFMLEKVWDIHLKNHSFIRIIITAYVCAALYLVSVNDHAQRWTSSLNKKELTSEKATELGDWMPGSGGIMYNETMGQFYHVFYHNPHGTWKYALGFEPGLMTSDNLNVYRAVKWNDGDARALLPWVAKMRKEDRMLKKSPEYAPPALPQLEWKYVADDLWIGRLPAAKHDK